MNLTELLSTLEAPIVVRPTRRMTQGEMESYLDKAADILRGNADHSEFRGDVFALPFHGWGSFGTPTQSGSRKAAHRQTKKAPFRQGPRSKRSGLFAD